MAFLPILNTESENLPKKILVVGDPNRLDVVAKSLQTVEPISENREYRSIRGSFNGQVIGAVSHGVGSAGAGVCFEELCQSGATRIIRAGSAGGMQPNVGAGDLVISTAAVREEGLSHKLVPSTYPAVATPDVLMALRAAAMSLGIEFHEGLLLTSDMFYPHDVLGSDLPLWQKARVKAVEMEVATLFVICGLHQVEAGAVVAIDGNPLEQDDGSMGTYDPHQEKVKTAVSNCLMIALTALVS
jgi:uridine phosphorylase|tara:strand:+ start:24 stop:752 length:729 start_codon:yes stop_codon:yes gene_type:complete